MRLKGVAQWRGFTTGSGGALMGVEPGELIGEYAEYFQQHLDFGGALLQRELHFSARVPGHWRRCTEAMA